MGSEENGVDGDHSDVPDASQVPIQVPEGSAGKSQGIVDEIQALKAKLFHLESQIRNGDAQTPQKPLPSISQETADFKRMEACLYRHRKEWAMKNSNLGDITMLLDPRPYYPEQAPATGPWSYHWDIYDQESYFRPDPFDPSHQCTSLEHDERPTPPDGYDRAIDYGHRRDRLRKHFEWEMDRLYLVEEVEARRRAKLEEEKAKQEKDQAPGTKNTSNSKGRRNGRTGSTDLSPGSPNGDVDEPKINRLEWSAFRRLTKEAPEDACIIDILVGDPVLDDAMSDFPLWFGSALRGQKVRKPQETRGFDSLPPGQAPMPERIRINSEILISILLKILGSDGNALVANEPIVFIRPFKALTYCQQAIRDWCMALERKYGSVSTAIQKPVAEEDTSQNSTSNPESLTDTTLEPSIDSQGTASSLRSPQVDDGNRDDPSDQVAHVEEKEKVEEELELEDDDNDYDDDDDDDDDMTKSPLALKHLQCLVSFLDSEISAKQKHLASSECRKVFFSDLWHLFRPGAEVIGHGGKQAYRVIKVSLAKHRVMPSWQARWYNNNKKQDTPFSITCVHIDFDGKSLGPVQTVFEFKRFEGEREITSLEVYPLRFHPVRRSDFTEAEWTEMESMPASERHRRKLIRRGAKFLEVAAIKHMYYAGPTLVLRDEVESPVVIDFETAFSVEDKEQQQWQPRVEMAVGNNNTSTEEEYEEDQTCHGACCQNDNVHDDSYVEEKQREQYIGALLPKDNAVDEQPSVAIIPRLLDELKSAPGGTSIITDDELVIMSYRVFGFVLRNRKWANLDLSYLTDIHPPQNEDKKETKPKPVTAFDQLVLEDGHKSMIVSLIAQHFRDKKITSEQGEQVDIVKGKGKGLILLLHGAPGVGKTSTAEGAAELFKKPLFQITCGDLGTTAKEVEKALETNFALANRWDCILLLDEADVFLAERTKEDFKRNGLVAVFLRVMEYYAGILFLTTNRVGDFDEAFTSRIHISLYYPELNQSKTVDVFKINMDMIEERFNRRGRRIDIDKMGIGNFAGQHFLEHPHARWNGRQVRNACQTALALAEFEAQGNSHQAILNPDAVIKLTVEHFQVVQNAYLEFTKYINELYGTSAARRAKEARRRALRMADDDDAGMGGVSDSDRRRAFAMASQAQHHRQFTPQQQYHYPQEQPAQPAGMHQKDQRYASPYLSGATSPRPAYPDPRSHLGVPSSQNWNIPTRSTPATFQMSTEEHQQQDTSPFAAQHQPSTVAHTPAFQHGIQEIYAAGGQQRTGVSPVTVGNPVLGQWSDSQSGAF
ncbi:hypothetical protein ASPZODRAFT_137069 [Penicilliopsis zonata CBS 506.65]|uniref:AAA+ ATPase domain-containing protein n=1 Tax=Penicilliopsis zonata CBS 506.65 TaxID=1073090 RepID=A0A1L9S698_9EURO|nr:hypothetical protein ASPZODRAFT_137069 [Penicilliopsis zonata CBS 506.65]OJJ42682.1 hypothetical protein ASPZODRAFT_137069 [Penicilliopsis zonata CBS 506.65]